MSEQKNTVLIAFVSGGLGGALLSMFADYIRYGQARRERAASILALVQRAERVTIYIIKEYTVLVKSARDNKLPYVDSNEFEKVYKNIIQRFFLDVEALRNLNKSIEPLSALCPLEAANLTEAISIGESVKRVIQKAKEEKASVTLGFLEEVIKALQVMDSVLVRITIKMAAECSLASMVAVTLSLSKSPYKKYRLRSRNSRDVKYNNTWSFLFSCS